MTRITEKDWNFEKIHAADPERAARLESCGPPEDLLNILENALGQAIDRDDMRIAVDSKGNKFMELRAIVQFPVPPELYDWFFNARTGYRAQFWISPEDGMAFNGQIIQALAGVLSHGLAETVQVRKIEVRKESNSREDYDVGAMEISRDKFLASLVPDASKIWIVERPYRGDPGNARDIGYGILMSAEKLCVPRWIKAGGEKAEGLCAPRPCQKKSWLDVKGGFLDAEGKPEQIKSQDKRARQIYKFGWT